MKKQYSISDWERRVSLSVVLGTLGLLIFLLLGTSEAQTGDVLTLITVWESGGVLDIAVGPKDELYVARWCWLEEFAQDGSRWVVPPTGERESELHSLHSPTGIAVDREGNVYVSEYEQQRTKPITQEPLVGPCLFISSDYNALRKITPAGEIILLAGDTTVRHPFVIGVDGEGRVYYWDSRGGLWLWRLDKTGKHEIVGGTGVQGDPEDSTFGDVDGKRATEVDLWTYEGRNGWVEENGDIYLAQRLYVFRIDGQTGVISRVAGNGRKEYSGDGGPAREAGLVDAQDVVRDRQGNLYVADAGSARVRRIDPAGIITTVAGTGEEGYSGDEGDPLKAKIVPVNLAVDSQGDVYVVHRERVRKIDFAPRSTAVTEDWGAAGVAAPSRLWLEGSPNPANREMVVSYALPAETQVRLEVVDLLGRQVRTLVQGYQGAGSHRMVWDGRDAQGREVGSGVYILCLQTRKRVVATRRVTLLK